MGVAIMSFIQSRDIIRSSCSAYILFMQSTRWITYNQNFDMITNRLLIILEVIVVVLSWIVSLLLSEEIL